MCAFSASFPWFAHSSLSVDDKKEKVDASDYASDDYVMFVSSRVVSLAMSHARVLTLCSVGGFGKSPISPSYPLVCTVCVCVCV